MKKDKENVQSRTKLTSINKKRQNFDQLFFERHKYIFFAFQQLSQRSKCMKIQSLHRYKTKSPILNIQSMNQRKKQSINKFIQAYKKANEHIILPQSQSNQSKNFNNQIRKKKINKIKIKKSNQESQQCINNQIPIQSIDFKFSQKYPNNQTTAINFQIKSIKNEKKTQIKLNDDIKQNKFLSSQYFSLVKKPSTSMHNRKDPYKEEIKMYRSNKVKSIKQNSLKNVQDKYKTAQTIKANNNNFLQNNKRKISSQNQKQKQNFKQKTKIIYVKSPNQSLKSKTTHKQIFNNKQQQKIRQKNIKSIDMRLKNNNKVLQDQQNMKDIKPNYQIHKQTISKCGNQIEEQKSQNHNQQPSLNQIKYDQLNNLSPNQSFKTEKLIFSEKEINQNFQRNNISINHEIEIGIEDFQDLVCDKQILSKFDINEQNMQDQISSSKSIWSYCSIKNIPSEAQHKINQLNQQKEQQNSFIQDLIELNPRLTVKSPSFISKIKRKNADEFEQINKSFKKVTFKHIQQEEQDNNVEKSEFDTINCISKYFSKHFYKQLRDNYFKKINNLTNNNQNPFIDKDFNFNDIKISHHQPLQWKNINIRQQNNIFSKQILIPEYYLADNQIPFVKVFNFLITIDPSLVYRLIEINQSNVVTVWLFFNNHYKPFYVDGYQPYKKDDTTIYGWKQQSSWVGIIIKAIAKAVGGYQKFQLLSFQECFKIITGRNIKNLHKSFQQKFKKCQTNQYHIIFNNFLSKKLKKHRSNLLIRNKRTGDVYFMKKITQKGIKMIKCDKSLKKYEMLWNNFIQSKSVQLLLLPIQTNTYISTSLYQSYHQNQGNIVAFKLIINKDKTSLTLRTELLFPQLQNNKVTLLLRRIMIYEKAGNQCDSKQMILKHFSQKEELQAHYMNKGEYRIFIECGKVRLKDNFEVSKKHIPDVYIQKDLKNNQNNDNQNIKTSNQHVFKNFLTILSDNKIHLKRLTNNFNGK